LNKVNLKQVEKKRFSFKRVLTKNQKERRSAIKVEVNAPEGVSIFKEIHWRSNPIGKVLKNLNFFKELAFDNIAQKS
jgi:hypothetical protein